MKTYDVIASLGGTCDVANQLRSRGLRHTAYPLDWCGFFEPKPLLYLPEGLRTDFRDFCRKENLQPLERRRDFGMGGTSRYHYLDTKTGWIFVHHFEEPIEKPGVWERLDAAHVRRWKRFLGDLEKASSALLILETWKPFDPDLMDGAYAAFKERFPQTAIDVRVLQFDCPADFADPGRWGGGLYRYKRARHRYDWDATSVEWDFLDDVRLSRETRLTWFGKRVRKLWKWSWKYLRDHGENVGSGSIR